MVELIIQPDKLFEALLIPGECDLCPVLNGMFDLLPCLDHPIKGRPDPSWFVQDDGIDCGLEGAVEGDHLPLNEIPWFLIFFSNPDAGKRDNEK